MGQERHDVDDFEYWSNLAQTDPLRFERERNEEVEKVIAQASEDQQERLQRLRWRIDQERAKASNPLSACIRLSKMMWDSVYDKGGLLSALESIHGKGNEIKPQKATIVPFVKK